MKPLTIEISPYFLSKNFNYSDLVDFIMEIDTEVSDINFTLDLLRKLIKGLEQDEDRAWIAKELGFSIPRSKKSDPSN